MHCTTRLAFTVLLLAQVASGCGGDDKDRKAPPAPVVEPTVSPTSLTEVVLYGSGEPNATIEVTGGSEVATAIIDRFTSRFFVKVSLSTGDSASLEVLNTLSVVAIDGAGNRSEATPVEIVYEVPHAETLAITVPELVSADDGSARVSAEINNNESAQGVSLEGLSVTWTATGPGGEQSEIIADTDAQGRASAELDGLTVEGEWTVVATAMFGESSTAEASATLLVYAGRPSQITVELSAEVENVERTGAAVSVPAGTDVSVLVSAADEAANSALAGGYDIVTDLPDALLVGDQLVAVQKAGVYRVAAVMRETSTEGRRVAGLAELTITAGAAATIELVASSTQARAGEPVALEVAVLDAYRNVVSSADAELSVSPSASPGLNDAGTVFTAEEAGTYTVVASAGGEVLDNVEIVVTPGAPSTLTVTAPTDVVAGDALAYSYEVLDLFGNQVVTPVSVSISDPNAFIVDDGFAGAGEIDNLVRAGSYALFARATGTALTHEQMVTVEPAAAFSVELQLGAQSALAGESTAYSVTIRDAYGNTRDDVPTLSAAPTPPLDQGFDLLASTFSIDNLDNVTGTIYTLTANVSGIDGTAELSIDPAAPVSLVFTPTLAQVVSAGTDASYAFTVLDAFGNEPARPVVIATSAPNALVLSDGLSGAASVTNLLRAGDYQVTAMVSGTTLSESRDLTVSPGLASRVDFGLTTHFTGATAGSPATVTGRAMVLDGFGNAISDQAPVLNLLPIAGTTGDASAFSLLAGTGLWEASFTVSAAGAYIVTATYDPGGLNLTGTDTLQVVSTDTQVPSVNITHVNGMAVTCTATECTLPGTTSFSRGQRITLTATADDDSALAEVSFRISGSGVSAGDSAFIGQGATLPLTQLFVTQINGTAVPGQARAVAQAVDIYGNTDNSLPVVITIDLGIDPGAGRTAQTVGGSFIALNPWDVAVDASGNAYVTYRDNANPLVMRFDASADMSSTSYTEWATFADRPEFAAVSAAGDLFASLDGSNEITRVTAATQAVATYVVPGGNVEGLSVLGQATPKTGRCVITAPTVDGNTVTIGTHVYEFDNNGSCTASATRTCLVPAAISAAGAALATAINANATSSVSAFYEDSTACTTDGGTTGRCVALIHRTAGTAATDVTVSDNSGTITCDSVDNTNIRTAFDAEVLFVATGPDIEAFAVQPGASPALLELYDFAAWGNPLNGLCNPIRGVLGGLLTRRNGANPTEPARLILWAVDECNDRVVSLDMATNIQRTFQTNLDVPRDIVYVPRVGLPGCVLVSNEGSGEIVAIDLMAVPPSGPSVLMTGFDRPVGMALAPDGSLYVSDSGFDVVVRVTPTTSTSDCF